MSEKTNVMKLYIDILHQIDNREPLTEEQDEYLCELINRGLIRYKGRQSGRILEPSEIDRGNITGLTYSGRMELARLEREQKELKARKWRWIAPALTFAAGVIFSTIVSILLPRLTNTLLDRWLSPEVHQVEAVKLPADGVDAPGK